MSALTGIVLLSSVVFLIDLGMPFHGFVQVDVSIFERIRKSISMVLAGVNDREQTTLWCGSIPREFVAGDLDKAAAKMRQVILPTAPGVSNEGPSSRVLVPLPAVSWPWVSAWGSLEPPRRDGGNARKTGKKRGRNGRDTVSKV